MVRIYKTKWVGRFTRRERISDADLVEAVRRAERGLIDADLGGGIIKQRIARAGQGRSGGYRMVLVFKATHLAVFLYGFAKSERENIEDDELQTLREIGASWLAASAQRIAKALQENALQEVTDDEKAQPSRLTKALLETADDMRRVGVMNAAAHEKITLRHLGGQPDTGSAPISGDEIRSLREQAQLSQAVFAHYLNLTVGYVSQLERGAKRPKGPALVLLNVIRRKD